MYTIAQIRATYLQAMKKVKTTNYAAIPCDIVDSRRIEDFRRKRDQKLRRISRLHIEKKLVLSEYAITAWDEFEGILSRPTDVPAVILDLRRHFHPFELWIAVGFGRSPRLTGNP